MINATERFVLGLVEVLAEAARPMVYTAEGRRLITGLQRKLAAYFRGLRKGFPLALSVGVWKKHPEVWQEEEEQEAVSPVEQELMLVYTDWIEAHTAELHAVMEESIEKSAAEGWKGSMREWVSAYEIGAPKGWDLLVPDSILEWTKDNAAELVKGIDEATVKRMARVIADEMEQQKDIKGITKGLQEAFGREIEGMAGERSRVIAVTETNAAWSEGSWTAALDVGSQWKEAIDTGLEPGRSPCEDVCMPNAEVGRIPINEPFPSGDMHTPFHPDCRCDTSYTGATRESVEKALGGLG